MREGFVAALGAHGKRRESQRLDFGPCGAADGVEVALDGMRHGVVGDAEHALDAVDGGFDRSAWAQADEEAVTGLLDALDGDAAERLPQRREQLAQEEAAVAALQPEFVVVNDDNGGAHRDLVKLMQPINVYKV